MEDKKKYMKKYMRKRRQAQQKKMCSNKHCEKKAEFFENGEKLCLVHYLLNKKGEENG